MKLSDNKILAKRDYNIELLRIVLMFMIVLLHMVSHGLEFVPSLIKNLPNERINPYHIGIFSFTIIGVNTFVFISGYYGIKYKLSNVFGFAKQALFTSLCILLAYWFFYKDISLKFAIRSFFPILSNYWWFLSTYVLLYFLSPFINKGIETLDQITFRNAVIGLFIFNCIGGYVWGSFNANGGYSILNFIFLYFLGRYMKLHDIFSYIKWPVLYYLILFTITCTIGIYLYQHNYYKFFLKFYDYNNPLILILSVLFFCIFRNMKINVDIRFLSKLTFGVYLFSDNDLARDNLPHIFSTNWSVGYILFITIIIYTSSSLLEFIRQSIFSLFEKKL
jgi:surface polysaccharide O-acyltransferase-like enzyme